MKRRGGEFGDTLVVDSYLWRELVGVHTANTLAVELLDEVFGDELADVANTRQSLNEDWVGKRPLGDVFDIDLVHAVTRVRAA